MIQARNPIQTRFSDHNFKIKKKIFGLSLRVRHLTERSGTASELLPGRYLTKSVLAAPADYFVYR